MKTVMSKAWEIARAGQAKFGGSVKDYFGQALKMAWALARKEEAAPMTATIVTSSGSRKHKTYVAKIVGTCSRFGLERSFINNFEQATEWSDKTFTLELNEGDVYEIVGANYNADRHYMQVVEGALQQVGLQAVKNMFAA